MTWEELVGREAKLGTIGAKEALDTDRAILKALADEIKKRHAAPPFETLEDIINELLTEVGATQ